MVMRFGMAKDIGQVAYDAEPQSLLAGPGVSNWQPRRYSEETAAKLDRAVGEIIERAFARAVAILTRNRQALESSAQELLKRETLGPDELSRLVKTVKMEESDGSRTSAFRHMAAS